jgi:hypothetical protein
MNCFVIMPFGNALVDPALARRQELIYSQWIKPTVESIAVPGEGQEKIKCYRSDKEFRTGDIITHVIRRLVDSGLVIADLTGRNPNVFI